MIGTIIKTEIKSEVKIELDCVNTRHKYKNSKFPLNPNYIHIDGTPCRSARKKVNELPDLPPVKDTPQSNNTNGLAVEILSQMDIDMTNTHTGSNETNSAITLPPVKETPQSNNTNGLAVETLSQTDIDTTNKHTGSNETNSATTTLFPIDYL